MYRNTSGVPPTPKIPHQVLPPSPSPVYGTSARQRYEYGSFTAPFPTTVPLRTTTPLRATTPAPETTRTRRDSSSSRSHEQHTRMRASSGPSKAPLKSILKKTGASVVNIFRPSSRAETRTSAPVDYPNFPPIPFEPPKSRGRTPVPIHQHTSAVTNTTVAPTSVHRSSSRDHSSNRSTDGSRHHRSSSKEHARPKYPGKSVTSSESGASSDHEYVLKAHRSNKHHSGHRRRSSATSSSDSGHMSDVTPHFKVKVIDNTPDVRHRSRHLPSTPSTRGPPLPPDSRLFEGYDEIKKVRTKPGTTPLAWPLIDQSRIHRHRQGSPVFFDVAFEPWHSVSIWSATEQRTKHFFPQYQDMPASSHCFLTKMNISCDLMDMWPITVERKEGIRCIDIYDAIYQTYSKPVTDKERILLGADILARSERAFRQRIKDSPGLPYYHEKLGVLRVDTLINQRIFGGLVQGDYEDDWKLILKDPRQF